ncbi:restriction endonuclease [Streptomyces lavendofoliae]|uniref:restriction endonuclease n=1 Tax=Streptomyces lavendofoliae TaxID=67314 RepID=UPI003D903C41
MDREAGSQPRPDRHLNSVLLLYDKPLYRDWAFWTTVGVAGMTAIAMGTSRDPTATSLPRWLDTVLAVITFAFLFGVVPAWIRLLVRRSREHRPRHREQRPPADGHAAAASDWQQRQQRPPTGPQRRRSIDSASDGRPSTAAASLRSEESARTPAEPPSPATVPLRWAGMDADGFERLLFDLLRSSPEYRNVQWLMHTQAADRGRDLSMDRVLHDSAGGTHSERVIVQAKHWLKKPVDMPTIAATVAAVKLWGPPVIRTLIIATSGHFSADAVRWAEQHNDSGTAPFVELWPASKLEALLAAKPGLAVAHGLRPR